MEQVFYAFAKTIQSWFRFHARRRRGEACLLIQTKYRQKLAEKAMRKRLVQLKHVQSMLTRQNGARRFDLFLRWRVNAHRSFEFRVFAIKLRRAFHHKLKEVVFFHFHDAVLKAKAKYARAVFYFRRWLLGRNIHYYFDFWRYDYVYTKVSLRKFCERRSFQRWRLHTAVRTKQRMKERRLGAALFLQRHFRDRFHRGKVMKQFFVRWNSAVRIQSLVRGHLARQELHVQSIIDYQIDYITTYRLWKQIDFKRNRELLVLGRKNPMERDFEIVHELLDSGSVAFSDLIDELEYQLRAGKVGQHEEAATTIQRYWRGYTVRSKEFFLRTVFHNEWKERDRHVYEQEENNFECEFFHEIEIEDLTNIATVEEMEQSIITTNNL